MPGLPCREGDDEQDTGGYSGFALCALPLRDSAGLPLRVTGFPHSAPCIRALAHLYLAIRIWDNFIKP